jgi:glycosyltransferase involved in cell wall biosynthesis
MIAILLATYNGEEYLEQLLDSLLNQTQNNWNLYISDDGSSDSTLSIIEKYVAKYSNVFYLDSIEHNKGAKNSFMWLLKEIKADYYMFCDQDDIWLPQKIEITFHEMERIENNMKDVPVLIHSDLKVVDKDLNVISDSFYKYSGIPTRFSSFQFYCAYNNITGCTLMINRKTRQFSLQIPEVAKMHDAWIGRVVSYHNGLISFINIPLILYRQHNNNVIGAHETSGIITGVKNLRNSIRKNISLYKEVCYIKKISLFYFLFNKVRFFIYMNLFVRI